MEIKITHEINLSPDVYDILKNFFTKTAPTPAPEIGAKKPAPVEVENDAPEKVSISQVKEAVAAKAQGGKRAKVKALLEEYGAEKVTELNAQVYGEFLEQVNAL